MPAEEYGSSASAADGLPAQRVVSPSGLGPGCERLEVLANLDCACGVQLVYIGMLELQNKPQPIVRVPAERETGDLLLSAINTAGDALRHARNDVAVEIESAVTGRDFPRADAAVSEAERVKGPRPAPGSPRDVVGDGLSREDPGEIDITAIEAERG